MADRIITPAQAVQTIEEISAPNITERDKELKSYAVADYLKQKAFRTIVDRTVTTASVRPYYAGLFNLGPGNIVSFQPMNPHAPPMAAINTWFVPTVSIDRVIANNNKVPVQSLAIIDITKSQPPFICTEKLTGCCFYIGWIATKGVMYMCHIQPSQTHDRAFIANYVRANEILPVLKSQLSKSHILGGDDKTLPDGYNKYTVSIVGFILITRIWMVFRYQYDTEHGSFMEDYKRT